VGSNAPQQAPPPDPRLVPALVAVSYLAVVIALWGILSLALDRDAIEEADAGPILGPSMAAAGFVVAGLSLWTLRRRRTLLGPTVAAASSVYVVMLIVGAIGYATTRGETVWLLLFPARYATSPFIVGAALLAGFSIVFLWVVTVRDRRSAGKPPGHEDI
jgi:hypothetical protein